MTLLAITLGILALAAVLGTWRSARIGRRGRWWRLPGSLVLAVGLGLILFPPQWPQDRQDLLVLAPGADAVAALEAYPALPVVALPGVETNAADIEPVPDLATALRHHPLSGRLVVVGDGLSARDREAVRGLNLSFEGGLPLTGIVSLELPEAIHAGRTWTLRGSTAGVADARVELRDRGGAVVATAAVGKDGTFALNATAKVEGQARHALRLLSGDGSLVEELPLVANVRGGDRMRVTILAASPDAELKYLRRWLTDSGHAVSSRIGLSRGIEQRQDDAAATPARLAEADLLLTDERAWGMFSASEKSAITDAVDQGMGVMLRVTGALPPQVSADWAKLGIVMQATDQARAVQLAGAPADSDAISLTRWPMQIDAAQSAALKSAADGRDLGRWQVQGHGRVGVWLLTDSYRLVLRGEAPQFESLWADVLATVARARGAAAPGLPAWPRAGQRAVICGLAEDASIETPDGRSERLRVDSGGQGCAAWWPASAGNYTVMDANGEWPLYVNDADASRTLWRAEIRRETQRLVRSDADLPALKAELPRWLLFLFWLPLAGLFWWLERRPATPADI